MMLVTCSRWQLYLKENAKYYFGIMMLLLNVNMTLSVTGDVMLRKQVVLPMRVGLNTDSRKYFPGCASTRGMSRSRFRHSVTHTASSYLHRRSSSVRNGGLNESYFPTEQ